MKDFKPYYGKESDFQETVARWLNMQGILWFHTPNGGSRHPKEAANLKKQGVKPGVPDVLILEPNALYIGFAIELKTVSLRGKKGKTTPYQEFWLEELQKRGFKTLVTHSLDEAIREIDEYLKTKKL